MTSLTLITSLNDLSPNTVKLVGIVSTCELGVLVVQSCPHVTPWTAAHQASLSLEFSRQENWSGLAFLSPGDFPTQESNPALLHCRQILYHLSHQGIEGKGEHSSVHSNMESLEFNTGLRKFPG